MKLKKLFENWDMTSIKINLKVFEMEWNPQVADMNASWEMYVELLTRITTQPLAQHEGDEETALNSIHALFAITREVMRRNGKDCLQFSKIAVVVLNQKIIPFTAKWHKLSLDGSFSNPQMCSEFRQELNELQVELIKYTRMLGYMAGIESEEDDLTIIEEI